MAAKKSSIQRYFEEVRNKVPVHWLVWEEIMNKMEDAERMQVLNRDTMIDSNLKDLLLFQFSQDDEEVEELFHPSRGSLSSLTNKARLAYALNLIDKPTLIDLKNIHKIRNIFAHSTDMHFHSGEIIKVVRELSTAKDKGKKKPVTLRNSFDLYTAASKACSTTVWRAVVKEVKKESGRMKKKKKKKAKKKSPHVK